MLGEEWKKGGKERINYFAFRPSNRLGVASMGIVARLKSKAMAIRVYQLISRVDLLKMES